MKVYFDGCSWVIGEGLDNQREQRFSKILCDRLGAEEKNVSYSGASNDRIVRNLLVENDIQEFDLAVITMTFPARTEFYSLPPYKGWISVAPKYSFVDMIRRLSKKILEKEVVDTYNTPLARLTDQKEFWNDYYRIVTTNEFFEMKEKIQKITIESYCRDKGVPLVLCTINPFTKEKFDLHINHEGLPLFDHGHPSEEGHRMIADDIHNYILTRQQ